MKYLNVMRAWLGAVLLSVVGLASAALPPEVATSTTTIQSDASAIFALVFPVVAAIVGLVVVVKLFKRFISKI